LCRYALSTVYDEGYENLDDDVINVLLNAGYSENEIKGKIDERTISSDTN